MSLAEVKMWFACTRRLKSPSRRGLSLCVLLLVGASCSSLSHAADTQLCPDLRPYYPAGNASPQEWSELLPRLESMMPSCLESAEYFALLGATQLNTGQVASALESLERALLLDPDNGAAQIDYAESLFLAGQLLPALEMNTRVLARQDLPSNLTSVLQARQQAWQQMTLQKQLLLDVTGGYDSNLNGAPTRSDLTLTLNGTPVALTLDPQYQPLEGIFANVRLAASWHQLRPAYSHDLLVAGRARLSSEGDTDLAQMDWRYTFAKAVRRNRWELGGGTSHLMFGGSPLYSIVELRGRYTRLKQGCQPTAEAATQYLFYHGQSVMNGLEGSLTGGLGCVSSDGRQQWLMEGGYLNNQAIEGGRPGGTRSGWQFRMSWQWLSGPNQLNAQLSYTDLDDSRSYSPLLANGAIRNVESDVVALRYKRVIGEGLSLLLNVTHQEQDSNLEPFNNRGTVAEVGLSLSL
jgi:tetratricopeptide (TPR) repeat protein